MGKSAITARPRKRPPTTAERLRQLDPDLADQMDELGAIIDREYDLAFNENPAPPILEGEVTLAMEGARILDTVAVLYATIDDVQTTADAARAGLARLALEAVPTYTTYQQPALPPPPDDDEDAGETEPLRVIREAATIQMWRQDDFDDTINVPTVRFASLASGWWGRLRGRARLGRARLARAAATLLLAGMVG